MRYKSCPRCKKKMPLEIKGQCNECRKEKYQYYKTLPSIKRDKVQKVYNNAQWSHTRLEAIKRANGLCEVCKALGRLNIGKEVHHIIKVSKGNNDTNYDLNNLVYVCTSCHRKIEGMNEQQILDYISRNARNSDGL